MTQTRYRENINIYIISILFHQFYTVTRSHPFSNYYMSPLKWVPDFYHLTVEYPHRGGRIGHRFCAKISPVCSFFNVLTLKRIFQMVSEDGAGNTKQQVFILSLRCKPMQVLYSLSLLCWHPPPPPSHSNTVNIWIWNTSSWYMEGVWLKDYVYDCVIPVQLILHFTRYISNKWHNSIFFDLVHLVFNKFSYLLEEIIKNCKI